MSDQPTKPDNPNTMANDDPARRKNAAGPANSGKNSRKRPRYKALASKYAHYLEITQTIAQIFASDDKLEVLLSQALQHLLKMLEYRAAQIYRLSPYGGDLWLYLEAGLGSKPVTSAKDIFSIEEHNIISEAARSRQVVYLPDRRAGRYSYHDQPGLGVEIKSELAMPLCLEIPDQDQILLGILRVQSEKSDDFDDVDQNFFLNIAALVAAAIKNNQTVQQLQNELQEIKILYDLQHKDSLDQDQWLESHHLPLGYQSRKNKIVKTDELSTAAKLALAQEQVDATIIQGQNKKEVVAPITLHGETIGILGIESETDDEEWSTDDLGLLEEVSSQVALAIENSHLLQQTQEQTKELTLLFETSRQLSEIIEIHQIYEILAVQIINYLHADLCRVALLDRTNTQFSLIVEKMRHKSGAVSETTQPRTYPTDDFPLWDQIIKRPHLITKHFDDSDQDPTANFFRRADKPLRTLSILPLIFKGNLAGILEIGHWYEHRHYTQNELQLTQAIISQIAVAVENAHQFQKTEEALAETQKLYQISRALVETENLDDVFQVVIDNVKAFDIDRVSISLLEANVSGQPGSINAETVTIVASWDRESEKILPVGSQISAAMFPLVEASAHPPFDPLVSEDLSKSGEQDRRMDEGFRVFMHEGLGAVTLFSTPMFLGTDYKGVLSISTRKPHTYTDQEIRVYQTLADQSIIAIENRRLFEAIRQERDQTALLHEIDRALGQAITIEQVEETILKFTDRIGAIHGEIYVTDGRSILSIASTIPDRRDLSKDKTLALAKAVLGHELTSEALAREKTRLCPLDQIDEPETVAELSQLGLDSVIATPFYSQRSNLRGLFIFFQTEEDSFSQTEATLLESIATQTVATLENVWLLQQTTIALSETEILYEATRDFNRARHPEELLEILARSFVFPEVGTEFDIDRMIIATINELTAANEPKQLNILAQWQNPHTTTPAANPDPILETTLSMERYPFISRLAPDTHHPIYYKDLAASTQRTIDEQFGQIHSILAIPLTVGNNWLGVLFLASRLPDFDFKTDLINRVTTLAGQAAVVIQNLQLIEETQQTLYNSGILSQLGQQLLVADTKEAIHELCLNAIAATEPGRGAAIFMYDDKGEQGLELELTAIWDSPDQKWSTLIPGTRFSAGTLGLTQLLKEGQTVVIGNVDEDDRLALSIRELLNRLRIKSLVAVPIWLNKKIGGFILISNHQPTLFSDDIIRLYEDMVRQVSGALENFRLLEEAQHRATLLQTAAEVSQAATSYLDLDTLLSQSVDLIRDRFNFYHISIFLVDDYQRYAVVKASTGKIGRKMMTMAHKLEVGGRSIVGTATATGKPRIALDVGKDADHFNNPLLPDTRSEMALPLIARGQVIGALDVQSVKRDAFSEIDITILQSMANQLANAIEAALSFQDSQKSLDQVRKLNEHYLREQWGAFLKDQKATAGYQLTRKGLIETQAGLPSSEIKTILETKQPVVISEQESTANGDQQDDSPEKVARPPLKKRSASQLYVSMPDLQGEDETATLVAPLSLQNDMIIGALELKLRDQNTTWEEDNLEIVEAVTRQAAQAIEATRLFAQTQAAREEAEALYKVGRALVTAESEQAMFHTVLAEMLSTLSLQQGGILLFDPDRENREGRLVALFKDGKPVTTTERIPITGNPSYEQLIAAKKPLAIEDVLTDPRVATVKDINISRNVASLLLVPIIINDQVIGSIGADSVGKKHVFTDWEISLVSAMADQLSIMLQNYRLLEETHRRAVQLQTSADVGRIAISILDEELMLEKAVDLIKDRFGFYHVQIFLIDAEAVYAVLYKSTGSAGRELLAANYKMAVGSQSVIGQATAQRKSVVLRDANPIDLETPHPQHRFLPDSQAELAIPLQVKNDLIGVLDVHSNRAKAFTEDDIATLEVLAAQLSIAIQNARAFREQQETAETLREMDKLKTQFLANMSHELRTPLNSIIGFSRVILKGIDGPLTELQKTDLTSIHHSGQHLLSLINNILDLSKIEAGKMELNFEEIEIEPIIKSVMSTAIALVKDKPVDLNQEVEADLPVIWADPTRIRQIILNLVSNACKFTEEGAVTLKAATNAKDLVISVSDTGIGIPPDQMDSVFEEFTQVDASTTRKAGGTGLGLPISRYFVEMHKGKIWVESTPGKGSIFSFTIPIDPYDDQAEQPPGLLLESEDEDQEKVIIAIDDDPGVINLYKRFLETQNYTVIGLNNGRQVVDQVKQHAPFAILLDVLMPDKDGWSIIRELKNDSATENIPVIICSIVSDKKRGFSLGAADYMTKPITESDLLRALKNLDNQGKDQNTVLVIDDQAEDILLIRRILEAQANYTIIEAKSGQEGLDLVKTQKPDLIVLDLSMPEIDGFAVVEALKNNDLTRAIPIVIVSAKDLSPAEEKLLTGQVEALLRKGIFTENELLEDVRQALSQIHSKETARI